MIKHWLFNFQQRNRTSLCFPSHCTTSWGRTWSSISTHPQKWWACSAVCFNHKRS